MTTMLFTPVMQRRFKAAHAKATEEGKDSFVFEGHEFLVEYAKYMIQYMEMENQKYVHNINN